MKLRVILISFLISANHLWSQVKSFDPNKTYLLSAMFSSGKKSVQIKDLGHIVFNPKENKAACFTACNFIQLNYMLKNQELKFTTITPGTEPCPDNLLKLENDFKSNLPKVTSYKFKGKDLIFFGGKDTLMIFHE